MEEKNSMLLTYLVLPVEVTFNPNLNHSDSVLFFFIKMLDGKNGCFASNQYLANLLGVSVTTISTSISKLKKEEYIYEVEGSFDGRRRILKLCADWEQKHRDILITFNDRLKANLKAPFKDTLNIKEIDYKEEKKEIESFSKEKDSGFAEQNLISDNSDDLSYKENKFDRSVYKESLQKSSKPLPKSNPDIDSLIQYWETIGLRKTRKIPGNKSYESHVLWLKKALAGTAFNDGEYSRDWKDHKFTIEEIKQSMKRFSLSARDPDYEPSNISLKQHLKSYSISQFFYNEMSKNGNKSFFIKFLKSAPPKAEQSLQPKKIPERFKPMIDNIVSVYKKFYEKKVLAGMRVSLNQRDENNFITGAMKLNDFIADNQRKLPTIKNDREMAMWVCEAIWNSVNEDATKISTTRFASDHTYKTLLPGILVNIGVTTPDYDIYDY